MRRYPECKERTHKLIVAGAELAALYNGVLEIEEVHMLINYLRVQKEKGVFDLTKKEEQPKEEVGSLIISFSVS